MKVTKLKSAKTDCSFRDSDCDRSPGLDDVHLDALEVTQVRGHQRKAPAGIGERHAGGCGKDWIVFSSGEGVGELKVLTLVIYPKKLILPMLVFCQIVEKFGISTNLRTILQFVYHLLLNSL